MPRATCQAWRPGCLTRTFHRLASVLIVRPGRGWSIIIGILFSCLSMAPLPLYAGEVKADSRGPEIIKETLAAYGGEQAIGKIRNVFARGSIEAPLQGEKGTSTRYMQRPRRLRVELAYEKSAETRVLNGTRGWRSSDNGPLQEVKGAPYLAMVYQFKYLDLPFGFVDKGYAVTLLGRETLHGTPVDVFQLSDEEGPSMLVYIDAATHLITRVAASFTMGKGSTVLAAEFSDFREVGGVKFPFRITNFGGDKKIAETVLTDLRINGDMKDSLFQP